MRYEGLKEILRNSASDLRKHRLDYKEYQRSGTTGTCTRQCDLSSLVRNYRHFHIAYCELRGKTRDQIEKPRKNNLPSEAMINAIKDRFFEQVVCSN